MLCCVLEHPLDAIVVTRFEMLSRLGCAASRLGHLGLDGGFIHARDQKSRGEGGFEVIAGKSMPEEGAAKCFAYVQT